MRQLLTIKSVKPFVILKLLTALVTISLIACPEMSLADLDSLIQKAEKGDASAQYELGKYYYYGDKVPK